MKKSNKLTVFYVISSVLLFLILLGGGVYGVYVSVGLSYAGSNMTNISNSRTATNVAYNVAPASGGSSMTGVIILSVALIVLSVLDLISLIRQIVLFKQFKAVKNSAIESAIEKKVKSKGRVVFFACLVDFLSLVVGGVGLFVNARHLVGIGLTWVLYVIDASVCVFAVVSFVLLLVKLKKVKQANKNFKNAEAKQDNHDVSKKQKLIDNIISFNVDELEYCLLKLKHLKSSRIISLEEYQNLRKLIFDENEKTDKEKNKAN